MVADGSARGKGGAPAGRPEPAGPRTLTRGKLRRSALLVDLDVAAVDAAGRGRARSPATVGVIREAVWPTHREHEAVVALRLVAGLSVVDHLGGVRVAGHAVHLGFPGEGPVVAIPAGSVGARVGGVRVNGRRLKVHAVVVVDVVQVPPQRRWGRTVLVAYFEAEVGLVVPQRGRSEPPAARREVVAVRWRRPRLGAVARQQHGHACQQEYQSRNPNDRPFHRWVLLLADRAARAGEDDLPARS